MVISRLEGEAGLTSFSHCFWLGVILVTNLNFVYSWLFLPVVSTSNWNTPLCLLYLSFWKPQPVDGLSTETCLMANPPNTDTHSLSANWVKHTIAQSAKKIERTELAAPFIFKIAAILVWKMDWIYWFLLLNAPTFFSAEINTRISITTNTDHDRGVV